MTGSWLAVDEKQKQYAGYSPYRAKMELIPGDYEWTSAHEHLKKRNKFFISPLPKRIGVDDWWGFHLSK